MVLLVIHRGKGKCSACFHKFSCLSHCPTVPLRENSDLLSVFGCSKNVIRKQTYQKIARIVKCIMYETGARFGFELLSFSERTDDSVRRELSHRMVRRIGNVEISLAVIRHPSRAVE